MFKIRSIIFVFCIIWSFASTASAQDRIMVAVAANFIEPFKEIAVLFETNTHIRSEPTFSSTGKLFAQISEGAPYDVFLSADEKRPAELYQKGLSGKPIVYATGEVVLWTVRKDLCSTGDWKAILVKSDVKKIAIANIETAPYGTASMNALKDVGLWDSLQGKFVFPQDIAQAFQYASTGSVDAGFCALSSALSQQGKAGCYLVVKEAPGVVQAACVLGRTGQKAAAEKFAAFLLSPEADHVKKKYGYK
ncbi:MAG: molybdate ABC transporter substrate-binding protein [Desulfomonilia bacterium]